MDLTWFVQLSKPVAAALGALFGGGLAVIAGTVMLFLLRLDGVRGTEVAKTIFSRVSPKVFYFGVVAPVWAFVGGMFGYMTAGATP